MKLQTRSDTKMPLSDQRIVELYWMRDEKAIEETDYKYRKHLFSMAYNIVHDLLDCEECLNDTYLGTWKAIPPSKPDALKAFLTVILRRAATNRYHSNVKKRHIPSEMTVSLSELEDTRAGDRDVGDAFDSVRLGRVISGFVRSLPERKQFVFMSRYYAADTVDTIARDLGVSRSTVNKELAAIRKALKETLESEGYLI